MIKYNIKTVNDWLYNSNPIKGMYYNGRRVYRRFVANGQPTPPTPSFDGKFKAEYSDGRSYSAACNGNTELTSGDTRPNGYTYTMMTTCEIGSCITSIYGGLNGSRQTSAFINCTSLSSVTIPDSVTSIGKYAFLGCRSLTSIDIPNSVTSIGDSAFWNCSGLTSINIPSGVTSISDYIFYNCNSLTNVTIPDCVITIGNDAFNQCYSLTSIDIPDSVTTIGQGSFRHCTSLSSINIPSGVTSIGGAVFEECTSLTEITVPSGVTTIGGTAFYNCNNLQNVVFLPPTPPTITNNHFYNIPNGLIFYVPDASVDTYKTAANWSSYASRIKPLSEKPQ